jgi:UDP:flavonoid glycosyltransferase YjiC (YdhE family)
MARFLISTMPTAGTMHPALAVAAALAAAGHQVVWHTWPDWADAVERTGATFVPARHTLSLAELPAAPDPGTTGIRASISVMRKHLVERMAGQVADYEDIHRRYPVDALLVGLTCLGAQAFAERHGVPWASLGISPLTLPPSPDVPAFGSGKPPAAGPLDRAYNRGYNWLSRIVQTGLTGDYNRHRARLGLRPLRLGASIVDHLISPRLHLLASTPAIEYPRRAWPPQVRFVGPLLPPSAPERDLPPWWGELDGTRPVVHITQGTIATHPRSLTRPALRALASLDALIVVTTPDPGRLRRIPRNTRVASFIPHAVLLPRVDVMITNGGFNGTKMALAHGVPLLFAPWGNDQPDVAARVARAGAGINLGVRRPSPEAVSTAVQALLSDPGYGQAARRIRAEFAEYGNGDRVIPLLHALATNQDPSGQN